MKHEKLLKKLINVAERKSLITYEEVADLLGLNLDDPDDHYHTLPTMMGELNEEMMELGKPMITALIVLKNSRPYTPGEGFYNLMIRLKRMKPNEDRQLFWAKEVNTIHNTDWRDINV